MGMAVSLGDGALPPIPDHGSGGIPRPWDAAMPVLELERAAPHTNLKTSRDLALEELQSSRSIPRTQIPQILLTTNPPQLSSLLGASLFILAWFYFVWEHQQTAPRVWERERKDLLG